MKKVISLVLVFILCMGCVPVLSKEDKGIEKLNYDRILDAVEVANDTYQAKYGYDQEKYAIPNCYIYKTVYQTGNMEAYYTLGKEKYLEYAENWAESCNWTGNPSNAHKEDWTWGYNQDIDSNAVLFSRFQGCFQIYLDLYNIVPEDYKIARCFEVIDYQIKKENVDFWAHPDDLYMVMPVMIKMYKLTGEEKYINSMYKYFEYTKELLYDEDKGLFSCTDEKKAFYSIENALVLAALAKVLQDLPKTYVNYNEFYDLFVNLAERVNCLILEDDNGYRYWSQLMLKKEPVNAVYSNGYETYSTAMFTYALAWGINNGILEKSEYSETVTRAWNYLEHIALQPDGRVGYVKSIGSSVIRPATEKDYEDYGVGAFLLAGCEMSKLVKPIISPWAEEYCKQGIEFGWTENMPNDFTKEITREQFCIIAEKVLKGLNVQTEFKFEVSPFDDTRESAVWNLCALGIINGKGDRNFAPDDLITREEAAVILRRMCTALKGETDIMVDMAYADDEEISDWAKAAVYNMATLNIMQGTDKGFEPKGNITIEQTIAILLRLFDICKETTVQENFDITFADNFNALMPRDENYMFSPLSIKIAFALLANGADEETKEEILEVFNIEDMDDFNSYVDEMIELYKHSEEIDVSIANSIWINREFTKSEFDGDFEFVATEYYNSDVGKVVSSNAVSKINEWVSQKTNDKIDRIILRADFLAAIVNATYFKGMWMKEFDEADTSPDIFHNADNSETETDFMCQKSYFNYCETNQAKIIELPYKSDSFTLPGEDVMKRLDISMYLLLSDEEINVINQLDSAKSNFKREMVKLSVPKFELTYSMDLWEYLEPLGIERVFDGGLPYVLEYEDLFVDSAVHKTYIKVDEKGTEAVAVTGIMLDGMAMPPSEEIEFKADKPFYFVIRDNTSGEILFMGRYAYAE